MNAAKLVISTILTASCFATASADESAPQSGLATRNVIFVTMDGLRWQEVFRGAEESLIDGPGGGVTDKDAIRKQFWRSTPEERREALLPFFWTTVAKQGQLFGNADKGSSGKVTNGKNFSYPGYNEMITGAPDPRVDSNDAFFNPNVNVFEWLNGKPEFQGKIQVVGSWDRHLHIFNAERSGLPVNAGWTLIPGESLAPSQTLLNSLMSRTVRDWDNCRNDVYTFQVALEHLRHDTPRVLFIGLGDTDEYAHGDRYDKYLTTTHIADQSLKALWEEIQSHPQYKDRTTLVLSTDHGRGDAPEGWKSHGAKVQGSEAIWIGVIGPDTQPLGERTNTELVTQSQIAATIAALLGEDYNTAIPQAASPIADVLSHAAIKVSVKP